MKKYITIAAACFLLWACSTENPAEISVKGSGMQTVPVRIQASIGASAFETGSEIIPMTSRAPGETAFALYPQYECIIMKDMGDEGWIIDQILKPLFREEWDARFLTAKAVEEGEVAEPFEIELRPGKYKMLLLFNSHGGAYNTGLYEGMKIDTENVPYAVKYAIPQATDEKGNNSFNNVGHHVVDLEIFSAFKEFEVSKADSLAPDEFHRTLDVTADRRVAKFRVTTKAKPSGSGIPKNFLVQMGYTLRATDPAKPFCEGIDLFNRAWYSEEGLTSIDVVQTFNSDTDYVVNGRWYVISTYGSRTYNPYYFVDPDDESGTPFEFGDFLMTGEPSYPHMVCLETAPRVLVNNEISGVVMEEDNFDASNNRFLFYMTNEDVTTLFPDNFEFNPGKLLNE